MAAAAALITVGVGWLVLHAVRTPAGRLDHRHGMRAILWLGAIGPTLLLTTLLVLSLTTMRTLPVQPGALRIAVGGEQLWWRACYLPAGGHTVETANTQRVPENDTASRRGE